MDVQPRPTVIVALDGVLDASLGVVVDVLGAADRIAAALDRPPPFSAEVRSVRREVRLGSGLALRTHGTLGSAPRPAIVIVPGVNAVTAEAVDAALETRAARSAARWIADAAAEGVPVAAGCTAVFLVARAGLLDGRRATTMWALGPLFRKRFPQVELDLERTAICDGPVWTSGAALSVADLSLALVRHHAGPSVADLCLRYLALDTRPTQARYFVLDHVARTSPELARAEAWIRARLGQGEPFTVPDVARAVGASPRTFARRVREALGTSAIRFVQRLRVEHAEHLLVTTQLSLAEIGERVGYRDASTLRRVLQRETGRSARAVRAESARRRGEP